ncbi:MAG: four helix bundle protein [Bacteroidetes bacterium]|nr:four helix bundle protein [Bacteroidota bacterium]
MKSHQDLDVWKDSMKFSSEINNLANQFPKVEIYGLSSQIKRSAASVSANISEGAGRKSTREFIRFLIISQGSLSECKTHLKQALASHFLSEEQFRSLHAQIRKITAQLSGLIKALERKLRPM